MRLQNTLEELKVAKRKEQVALADLRVSKEIETRNRKDRSALMQEIMLGLEIKGKITIPNRPVHLDAGPGGSALTKDPERFDIYQGTLCDEYGENLQQVCLKKPKSPDDPVSSCSCFRSAAE